MHKDSGGRWSPTIIGILAGLVLLAWPLSGSVSLSLTLVLIVFFVFEGVATIMYAVEHRRGLFGRWGWMPVSGIVDLILVAIAFAGLPATAPWAPGVLVGFNRSSAARRWPPWGLHARSAPSAPA